ncbi:MAG: efflux RND transporter permease subunit [Acidimicrobiales bacterium]
MPGSPPPERTRLVTRAALLATRRPRATLVVWAGLLLLGSYAYADGLDREGFPPVNIPVVVAEATYFVDDPARVDAEIAIPFEAAYADVEGVDQIRTFARDNGFVGVVEFDSSFSSRDGVAALTAVAEPVLPDVVDLTIEPVDATKFNDTYDIIVTIIGPDSASADTLQSQASRAADMLDGLDEVSLAEPLDLLTASVNPTTAEEEIRRTSFTRYAEQGDTSSTESIGVGLIRNDDADVDTLEFSDAVQQRLDDGVGLDEGFRAVIGAEFADDIRAQLGSLTSNLLVGLVAVALISLLLIGWRAAVLTAAFMATVMLTSLIGLLLIGYSLNTITLFGLILTLGLLVDDAIVVSESVDANRDIATNEDPREVGVIRAAVDRVGAASFAGTLSTLTVFAPMVFISGILGEFIRPIPVTVMLTLALSFLLSVTVIPTLGRVFILRGSRATGPVVRLQKRVARDLGRLAAYPAGHGWRGRVVWVGLVALAVAMIANSFGAAGRIGFNIFPPTKDSNALQISVDFDPGTTIDVARAIQADIDTIVLDVLGDDAERYQVVSGNARGSFAFVDLVPMSDRGETSPGYVDRIEQATAEVEGVRVVANPVDVGPPVDEFPFQVQIVFDEGQLAAAEALAMEVAEALPGSMIDKTTGDPTRFTTAFVASADQVWRTDGVPKLEVRAAFDTDDTTSNLTAAEDFVADRWPAADLEARGLDADALNFDFGLESDNQDDFASLGIALIFAIVLTLLFLVLQFRSLVQPLLVFLAVPFSFFGVFNLLERTDNSISFFVGVGFIALIGVAVNNTILLVDAANQARGRGGTPAEAIREAVERRFRPLVVTTATTVAGLLPLALSDPFWEALCFVLIGGLVSSTFLVLTAFPALYLAVETVRARVNPRVRRRFRRA